MRLVSLLRRSEAARLGAAAVVAAGAVALAEGLTSKDQDAGSPARHQAPALVAGVDPSGATNQLAGKSAGGHTARSGGRDQHSSATAAGGSRVVSSVASSPAVLHALRKGWMTVVIDQPPPGLFTEQNRSVTQGAEVAARELNAGGGLARRVHVRLVRQRLDGLSAGALRGRLQSEAAAALILPCDTDSQFTIAAEAARFGTLMLAPCNADPQAGHDFPTYWPVGAAASDETLELASFMQVIGRGNVFIVETPGSRYVQLLTSWFRNAAQTRNMQVVGTASVAMSTSNFASLAHAIQAAHPAPSAIFTALPPPYVNRLAAGLAAHGVSQAVVGTAVMDTPLTLAKGGEAVNDAVFSTLGFPRESSAARRFAADYRRQFHKSPVGGFADVGLETVRLLADAAAKAHSAAPQAIQRALKGGIMLSGVGLANRSYQAGGDHNPIGEVAIEKIASDAFLPLFAGVPSGDASGR